MAQGTGDQPAEAGDQYRGLDRFGRVVDQRWRKYTGTASDLDRFVYTYDRSSNRTSKDVLGASAPTNLDEAYFYDPLDRLAKVNRGTLSSGTITDAAAAYAQTWTLDAVSNWATFVTDSNGGGSGGQTTRTRNHDRRNRITSISGQTTPLYDSNGNMTRDEAGRVFKYDAWDRLVVEGNGTENVRYTYDARGYRVERITGGVSVYYHYTNDWQLVEERLITGGGNPTIATYVWGLGYVDSLVLRDHAVYGRHYAQQDANFNVTSLTSSSGTVQERYVYDPYGSATYKTGSWGARASSSYAWVYLHQGLRLDPATNLLANRERDYSATLGRFNSTDRIGYGDGMNLYQGYGSGPVSYTDPLGLLPGLPGPGARPPGTGPGLPGARPRNLANPYIPHPVEYDPKIEYRTPSTCEKVTVVTCQFISLACDIATLGASAAAKNAAARGAAAAMARGAATGVRRGGESAAAKLGRLKHKQYNPGPGYQKEVRLPSGKRADAVNFETCNVRELKPNNPRAIRRGQKQVEGYRRELENTTGRPFTGDVDTY